MSTFALPSPITYVFLLPFGDYTARMIADITE